MKPSLSSRMGPFAAALILLSAIVSDIHASVLVTVSEIGGNVVFSGSGTLDVSALTSKGSGNLLAGSDFGKEFFLGADPGGFPAVDFYGATGQVTAPAALFAGDLFITPQLGTGPRFGIAFDAFSGQVAPAVTVPAGYVSGTTLSSTSTYSGKTLASLGLIPGSYTWSWAGDSLTLNIAAVPAPAAVWLLATGLIAVIGWTVR